MADLVKESCRLCLVTPPGVTADAFAPVLDGALSGGDVASLIITTEEELDLAPLAKALVPVAQAHGVAAIIRNDTQIAGRSRADGVHIDAGLADLKSAISSLRPQKIVGAGGVRSRHDAMLAGEADPDYVFFGRLDGDTGPLIFEKALDVAGWWAELFQIPAVVMGGTSLGSVRQARDAGIEFVALRRAVWEHPVGGREAVAEANRLLTESTEGVS